MKVRFLTSTKPGRTVITLAVVLLIIVIAVLNLGSGPRVIRYDKPKELNAGRSLKTDQKDDMAVRTKADQEFVVVTVQLPRYHLVPTEEDWRQQEERFKKLIDLHRQQREEQKRQGWPVIELPEFSPERECSEKVLPSDFSLVLSNGSLVGGQLVGEANLQQPDKTEFEEAISRTGTCNTRDKVLFHIAKRLLGSVPLSVAFIVDRADSTRPTGVTFRGGSPAELRQRKR